MLGTGEHRAYLYDKGGERQIAVFERLSALKWERVLDDISEASLTAMTPPGDDWHGNIRAWRHELVIFRDSERVWEGPIYRVVYGRGFVSLLARDVLAWTTRRSHRGRFTDPVNAVGEVQRALTDAFLYDDPNVVPWIDARPDEAPLITTAVNTADGYYWDAIGDIVDQGVHLTAVGRRIVTWPAAKVLSQTRRLDSEDISEDVTVIEDGLGLSTRAVLTGGTTFGATTPEPLVTNFATNPTFEAGTDGWKAPKYFALARVAATWGHGKYVGRITAKPPSKPAGGASAKTKSAYNAAFTAYEQSDVIALAQPQAIRVHEGEDLSATLMARGTGATARYGRVGLRLVGIDADGVVSDRAFAEGPPVVMPTNHVTQQLFVTGTVPADIVKAFVEVYRDTSYVKPVLDSNGNPKPDSALTDVEKTPVKWSAGDGLDVDQFGWFRGRIETWFAGDSKDDATFRYDWTGGPNASTSTRTMLHPVPDPYYGLVESLGRSNGATSRVDLEAAARAVLAAGFPSPLGVDVPQSAPLKPSAAISMSELVAGAVVPVDVRTTSRHLSAACLLDSVQVAYTPKDGEKVTVTLVTGQTWEVPAPVVALPAKVSAADAAAMLKANKVAAGMAPEEGFENVVVGAFVLATGRYIDATFYEVDYSRPDPVRLTRGSAGHGALPAKPSTADRSAMLFANQDARSIPGETQFESAVIGSFVLRTHRFVNDTAYDVDYGRTDPVRLLLGSAAHT